MTSLGLVDSHIHLTDFETGTDIPALVDKAAEVGVSHLVCNGTSEEDWPEVLAAAKACPRVIPCFGVHPWFTDRCSQDWVSILEHYLESVPSGVGEIGLDRNIESFDKAVQEEVFRIQLAIAREYNRPPTIHCVKAWGWLLEVFQSEPELPTGMLIHAYGGAADMIQPLVKMGAYFSFCGKVLEPNYERARKALLAVPLDRLLLETDAPGLLPPERFRTHIVLTSDGREHNSPANLPSIMEGVAALLGKSPESFRAILAENAQRFFGPILIHST